MVMDIDFLKKLSYKEGAELLALVGYVKDCGVTSVAAWASEFTRDECWILYDANGAEADIIAWTEYFNFLKKPPRSDADIALARWERVNWRIARREQ